MRSGVVWQAGIVLTVCIGTGRAGTVSSLDQIPAQLKTDEAKSFWQQQMAGKLAPDGLGVHLPASLTAKSIIDLLVPRDDRQPRTLVGAKPWPGRADTYVAIVCTGGAPSAADAPRCAQPDYDEGGPPWHVYLGVIETKSGAVPRLIARSGTVDRALDWDASGLPARPMAAEDARGHEIRPQSFERFDLARYEIAPGEPAFGRRAAAAGPGRADVGLPEHRRRMARGRHPQSHDHRQRQCADRLRTDDRGAFRPDRQEPNRPLAARVSLVRYCRCIRRRVTGDRIVSRGMV